MSPASRASVEAATARIGQRLTTLRTAQAIGVSELARRASVSSSLISQIERGHSRPSVATLFAVARVLDVPVDAFFAEADDEPANPAAAPPAVVEAPVEPRATDPSGERHVVRRDHRASIDIRGGVRWERLTASPLSGVEFLELVYAPGAESDAQAYRHPGVELVLVTQGVMTIVLAFEEHRLQPGDSIAFPSTTPHRYTNDTDAETRAVTVLLQDDLSTLALREPAPGAGSAPGAPGAEPAPPRNTHRVS